MVAGCKKSEPAPPAPSAEPPAAAPPPAASSAAAAPSSSGTPENALPTSIAGLSQRLSMESSRRPPGDPSADAVFEAFSKAGVTLLEMKQHLASPYAANYCMEGHTANGVYADVCEFSEAEKANASKEVSTKAFAAVPNRTLLVRKKTLLTIRQGSPGPKDAAEAKAMTAAFTKL
jgi:hypothetical protein